jgi:hypothetical protein
LFKRNTKNYDGGEGRIKTIHRENYREGGNAKRQHIPVVDHR